MSVCRLTFTKVEKNRWDDTCATVDILLRELWCQKLPAPSQFCSMLPAMFRPKACYWFNNDDRRKYKRLCHYGSSTCIYGEHVCATCGSPGHGARGCYSETQLLQRYEQVWEAISTTGEGYVVCTPPVPAKAMPTKRKFDNIDSNQVESSAKRWHSADSQAESHTSSEQQQPSRLDQNDESSAGTSSERVWKPFKGYGKGGSLGIPVEAPFVVEGELLKKMLAHCNIDALPATTKQKNCPESKADWTASIPKGTPATQAEINSWMENWRIVPKTTWPPQVHDRVCWWGLKKGPKGGDSSAVEYFHGKIHGLYPHNGRDGVLAT